MAYPMNSTARDSDEQRGIPVPVLIAVVVLAVLLAGWMGWKFFGPPPAPDVAGMMQSSAKTPEQKADRAFLADKAKETGGDISRLSRQDYARVQQITHGHGAAVLKAMAGKR